MTSINKKVKVAHEIFKDYLEIRRAEGVLFWRKAELLYELKKSKLYKYVFGGNIRESDSKTWTIFCAEIKIPRSTVDYWVRIYEVFIIECKMNVKEVLDVPPRRLLDAIPLIKSIDKAYELIGLAKVLSLSDWIKEMRAARGKQEITN